MIADGKVRLDGKWIARGYFNNALFRTAAIYHRVLKIVVGERAYVPALVTKAQATYPRCRDPSTHLEMVFRK
ncbi:MAG TPA: hypothetical protein VKH63_16845 [Candidatus Acidoferrum sp.]|nr:hypothetical protein [Candidatus Acidoferrum sp.]